MKTDGTIAMSCWKENGLPLSVVNRMCATKSATCPTTVAVYIRSCARRSGSKPTRTSTAYFEFEDIPFVRYGGILVTVMHKMLEARYEYYQLLTNPRVRDTSFPVVTYVAPECPFEPDAAVKNKVPQGERSKRDHFREQGRVGCVAA